MKFSTVLFKTPQVLPLELTDAERDDVPNIAWRRQYLLVMAPEQDGDSPQDSPLPVLHNREWIEACLERSPVKAICVDARLGADAIEQWAEASVRAGKRAFVQVPATANLPQYRSPVLWRLKRLIDWHVAAGLSVALSPVLAASMLVAYGRYRELTVARQWRIGGRGQLFRTVAVSVTRDRESDRIEYWPATAWLQLLNVLQGRMSLVGPHPLSLTQVVQGERMQRPRLNAVPGVTGWFRCRSGSPSPALIDAETGYLHRWSLVADAAVLAKSLVGWQGS